MKRRSLTLDEVEGLELDSNLEEPLKPKIRRESRQGFFLSDFCFIFFFLITERIN